MMTNYQYLVIKTSSISISEYWIGMETIHTLKFTNVTIINGLCYKTLTTTTYMII